MMTPPHRSPKEEKLVTTTTKIQIIVLGSDSEQEVIT